MGKRDSDMCKYMQAPCANIWTCRRLRNRIFLEKKLRNIWRNHEKVLISHLLQSKNEQTLLYIGVKPCAKGSIYVALEWGYLYLTFFNISNNLFDFLTSNNLGVESEAGFGM